MTRPADTPVARILQTVLRLDADQDPATRRMYPRHDLRLKGRCMFGNMSEHLCESVNISATGLAVACSHPARAGDRVVIYLDRLGRLEGSIIRATNGAFAVTLINSVRKRVKLASQIEHLVSLPAAQRVEHRMNDRFVPDDRAATVAHGKDIRDAMIIDVSRTGIALKTTLSAGIGDTVVVGKRLFGRVARQFPGGFAIAFSVPVPESILLEGKAFVADDARIAA